jgi:hypothetical protein
MNTEHLTAAMIDAYRARSLRTDQLLEVTQHMATCQECRQKVATGGDPNRVVEALSGEHLPYENLEAIVLGSDNGLDHVANCPLCAEELRDLRVFHATLTRPPRVWRERRVLVPVIGFAVALAVVSVAIFLRTGNAPAARVGVSRIAVPPVASLRDGGRVISLDPSGKVHGLDGISALGQSQIAEVLRSGTIALAPSEPDLSRSRETLLGAPADTSVLTPETPAGIVVASDRPAFRWHAPGNARDFRIAIYDANFEVIETSPALQGEVWLSAKPLPRGKVFSWTVSALVGRERVTVPHAPDPEAKFRIATTAEASEMDTVRKAVPTSDLRIAITAARLGFRDEARDALDRVRAQNPASPLVPHLVANAPSNNFPGQR